MPGAEASFLKQRLRLVLAVDRRRVLVVHIGRRAGIADARRHERVAGLHGLTPDLLRDELAIEAGRQGLAHAHVAEGRLGRVDDEEPRAEPRPEFDLILEALFQRFHLVRRKIVGGVELAGFIATDHRGEVGVREVVHGVDLDVLGTVIILVLDELDMGVRDEFGELVGAVRHHVSGLDEILAELFHRGLMHGQTGLVGQQFEEVWRCLFEADLERLVVDGLDADILDLALALVGLLGSGDRVQDVGVFCTGRRVHDATIGIHEVGSFHRVAVRPFDAIAKREAIGLAVVADFPLLGLSGDGLALGVVGDQTLEHVAQDMSFLHG